MPPVTLARNAMNTRFELVLYGDKPIFLRAAGEAALNEIERIENLLSLFKPTSEIARVNAVAAHQSVRVSPEVFRLLAHAQQLSVETGGAFDITMAPLLRCWGLLGRNDGRVPEAEELAAARTVCGHHLVELDPVNFTVRFARGGVMLDLGAIGKGHGVEQAAEILREAGVENALIHGGTSTVSALGAPPGAASWIVGIDDPQPTGTQTGLVAVPLPDSATPGDTRDGTTLAHRYRIPLRDESLSVSAVSGKCFVANGRTLGHVIDPRTGEPCAGGLLAAVVLPSASETDALSTALLVQGIRGLKALSSLRPGMRTLVVEAAESGDLRHAGRGIEPPIPGPVT